MLQRIQTVYLLLAIMAGAFVFVFPFVEVAGFEHTFTIEAFGVFIENEGSSITHTYVLSLLSILILLLPLLIISLYKKRSQQLRLCNAAMLVCLALLGCVYYYQQTTVGLTGAPAKAVVSYQLSSIIPIIQIILLFMARRAIKKDDDLIKSVDRLR